MVFRTLNADEIECRVASISKKGLSLLLYKDARVDQNILDETVGAMNWQRSHSRDNANCTVSIWDEAKNQWVSKEDTGKESNTEAEKGLASDSFKRACFNWGIGRELYTAPFIWVDASKATITENEKGKLSCFDGFEVKSIEYDERRNIKSLVVMNKKRNTAVFVLGQTKSESIEPKPQDKPVSEKERIDEASEKARVLAYINRSKMSKEDIEKLCACYKVKSINEMNLQQCKHYINFIKGQGGEI